HRIDRLSGIGQYGIILLGLDDGQDLSSPAPGLDPSTGRPDPNRRKETKLNFLRVFDQTIVRVSKINNDPFSPRYQQPDEYAIQFTTPGLASSEIPTPTAIENKVHWSRVIHLADNRHSSEVYGVPRMLAVLDYLYDLKKVVGGSAEMFYRGGFPGYSFEVN